MRSSAAKSALIVDGHNLLCACYYGLPDRIRSVTGEPIHGTYGFVAAVLKMIRRFEPQALVVCFDAEEPNFRNALSPTYKANRTLLPERGNPFAQLPDIRRGLAWLKVPWLEIGGVEADDVMGTLARRLAKTHRVYIASMDRDLFQLVDKRTRVYSRAFGIETEYGPREIVARYKVRPDQFVDYRTLVGDASDNIEGVDGIGAKTAARLLKDFGDIPGIVANLGSLRPRIAAALAESRERMELSKQLITIRTDLENELLEGDFSFSTETCPGTLSVRTVMREIGLMA